MKINEMSWTDLGFGSTKEQVGNIAAMLDAGVTVAVFVNGEPKGVLLPIEEYERLTVDPSKQLKKRVDEMEAQVAALRAEVEKSSELAAALAKVQGELTLIPQTKTATIKSDKGSYGYSYADLAAVVAVVYPIMSKHGLAYLAKPTVNDEGHFVLAYALLHEGGEREDGEYPLPAGGTAQQLGSAITYARRYTFCAVIGVVSDEDTDGREAVAQTTARPKRQQRRRAAAEDERPDDQHEELPDPREELRGRMGWLIGQIGMSTKEALAAVSVHAGRDVKSSRELTAEELTKINEALEKVLAEQQGGVDTDTGEVEMITERTQRRQRAQRAELDMKEDEPFWEWLEVQFGRPFTSSKQQTEAEAREACARMQIMVDAARQQEEGEQS